MANPGSWIKLDRNILRWGWYQDANTMRLFVHLLLKANAKDGEFMGKSVLRGQVITSQPHLSVELDIPQHQIRLALDHLKKTGEITVKTTPHYSLITVNNYEKFQDSSQPERRQKSDKAQQTKNKKNKEEKRETVQTTPVPAEEPKEYMPLWWEIDKPREFWGRFKSEDEYYAFRQNGGD